jgi:uncharacterized protein YjbI with pentapeptide repeats
MRFNRRSILIAVATSAAAASRSTAHPNKAAKRICQAELDEIIRMHGLWLGDPNCGKRCVLGGYDLSGLQFGKLGGSSVDLNGADFAQADLSGTDADDFLVHNCNFNGANFDDSHWRRPVFAFADMRRASAKRVTWGIPGSRSSAKRSAADFSHTTLQDADLTGSRICGLFYGTKLARASLAGADLSLSDFSGPIHFDMSFAGANLCAATLRNCHFSSVNFSNADCSRADFSHSVFSDLTLKDCNFHGAVFDEAEFERPIFAPYQIDDADLRQVIAKGI